MMAQMKGMKGENKKRNILTYGRERVMLYPIPQRRNSTEKEEAEKTVSH